MNLLKQYIPFHFLIGLLIGILLQFYTNFWYFGFVNLTILLIIFIVLLLLFRWKNKRILFTLSSYILFVFVGISTTYINNCKNYNNYFSKSKTSILEISSILKSNNYNSKYYANVIQTDTKKSYEKILVSIEKDTSKILEIGQQILTHSDFKDVSKPKNPSDFDYSDYLKKHGIHKQIFLKYNEYKLLETSSFSIFKIAQNFRFKIQKSLQKREFSSETYGIINALLLGDKTLISNDIKEDYTNSGVIHILAISGLHVGILMYILMFIFSPFDRIKNGEIFKLILVVLSLWFFAFTAGLSASIVRAVTMFSFVVLGELLNRKNYTEFSLISSMLFLLLIKPLFIFDLGFQLSYLAVFGIIWIRPLFLKLFNPHQKIIRFFWNLITVSVSAQIAVLPLSLYYFHQFPSLFLLSNIVIIPILGFILGFGIFMIFASLLNINLQIIYTTYEFIISSLNKYVKFISNFEDFIFKNIAISFWQMLFWYVLIFFTYKLISNFKPKYTLAFLCSILMLQSAYIFDKFQVKNQEELIVFQKSKKSVVGILNQSNFKILSNSNELSFLDNYKTSKQISSIKISEIPSVFRYKNDTFLVIDSLGIYNLPKLKTPIIILRQSPKINLNRLINTLKPKKIIADGSNYKSYIKRWKTTCSKYNIPFWNTYNNGFWTIKKQH